MMSNWKTQNISKTSRMKDTKKVKSIQKPPRNTARTQNPNEKWEILNMQRLIQLKINRKPPAQKQSKTNCRKKLPIV